MKTTTPLLLAPLLVPVLSCGDGGGLPSNADDAIASYAAIVSASYEDVHGRLQELGTAVDALVTSPSESTLQAARAAWLTVRDPYGQTEAYRLGGGPIDDIDDFVNAWPLNEAHLDYVEGDATAGLINDTSFAITPSSLEAANLPAGGGEDDIAVGFHAIEFLLWGQDHDPFGPGDRPYTDYVQGGGGSADNQDRRALSLTTTAGLLLGHFDALTTTWAEGGDYRTQLTTEDPHEALRTIFQALVIFSGNELGGERLAALGSHDQEEEQSCFSDNTDRDMVMDAVGIQNVYLGRYVRTDGTVVSGVGLYDVLAKADSTLADELRDRIATTVALALAIRHPYDREIAGGNAEGNARVQAFRDSLQQQRLVLLDAMTALGLPTEAAFGE